jgi:signal transduction histidine kinase/DNA-binding response OmpR family regulator
MEYFIPILAVAILSIIWIVYARRVRRLERRSHALEIRVIERTRKMRREHDELLKANRAFDDARREAEHSKMLAVEANQAKSRFLANMSHEIRTPLNAILGYTQILQREASLTPDQQTAFTAIRDSGEHLLTLINNVLDISRVEAGRMELEPVDFDIQTVIRQISEMFRLRCEQKGLAWRVETVSEPIIPVHGDENKIRQVLVNLCGNAVKFTDGGSITLRVQQHDDNRYVIEVDDSGRGIEEDRLKTIFEPFNQGIQGDKAEGTGLGLSITQRHVKLMHGTIDVTSKPNFGTCFRVELTLPHAQEPLLDIEEDTIYRLNTDIPLSALIVDDNALNRDVLRRILSDMGMEVRVANGASEAFYFLRNWIPSIVFMDVRMPGVDGVTATQRMWDAHGRDKYRIVMVSASVFQEDKERILALGVDDFIEKPFKIDRLVSCLKKTLNVEFETIDIEKTGGNTTELDVANIQVSLSETMRDRLLEAANLYKVTELDVCLGEMEILGVEERSLARHLRRLNRRFDMPGITKIVENLHA